MSSERYTVVKSKNKFTTGDLNALKIIYDISLNTTVPMKWALTYRKNEIKLWFRVLSTICHVEDSKEISQTGILVVTYLKNMGFNAGILSTNDVTTTKMNFNIQKNINVFECLNRHDTEKMKVIDIFNIINNFIKSKTGISVIASESGFSFSIKLPKDLFLFLSRVDRPNNNTLPIIFVC